MFLSSLRVSFHLCCSLFTYTVQCTGPDSKSIKHILWVPGFYYKVSDFPNTELIMKCYDSTLWHSCWVWAVGGYSLFDIKFMLSVLSKNYKKGTFWCVKMSLSCWYKVTTSLWEREEKKEKTGLVKQTRDNFKGACLRPPSKCKSLNCLFLLRNWIHNISTYG